MPDNLADLFLDTGLLQFGLFQNGNEPAPFRFDFQYLPAYPDVLQKLASEAQSKLEKQTIDRLLVTADSLPLGIALSLKTNISLVYDRNNEQRHDLIGAYHSGHQTVLLTNLYSSAQTLEALIAQAVRVGLRIQAILALVDLAVEDAPPELPLYRIVTLSEMVNDLLHSRLLPAGQAQAVLEWIAATRHPGATAP